MGRALEMSINVNRNVENQTPCQYLLNCDFFLLNRKEKYCKGGREEAKGNFCFTHEIKTIFCFGQMRFSLRGKRLGDWEALRIL